MSKKKLLLIGAGFEQITAIQIAQELGYYVVALDNNPEAQGAFFADEFYRVNVKNIDELIELSKKIKPDGVFCHAAELAVPVAHVADALNLAGNGLLAAINTTDKIKRIKIFHDGKIPSPEYRYMNKTDSFDIWKDFFNELSQKVVCKPPHFAGARGVQYIDNILSLENYYKNSGGVDADEFLMEEFIDGEQYNTESLIVNGIAVDTTVALRHYDETKYLRPYMIEDGYSAPYLISIDKHNQILTIINKCANLFGIMNGVLKGDFVYDDKYSKIKVFELASRTSGGRLCDRCHPLASGRNVLYPLIQMAMNDQVDLSYVEMKRNLGVSQRFFFPPAGKIIKSIKNLTYLSHHPNVNDIYFDRSLFKNNKTREIQSHADRAGYVICTGKTRDEADQLALKIVHDIDYVFED